MKKQLLSLVLVAAFAGNAYAADVQTAAPETVAVVQSKSIDATPALNTMDMQAAFQQDLKPMQVAALSGQEMKETEGAWGWFSAVVTVVNIVAPTPTSRAIGNVMTAYGLVSYFL